MIWGMRTAMRMNSYIENMTQEGRWEALKLSDLDQREKWKKIQAFRKKNMKTSKCKLFLCSFCKVQGVVCSNYNTRGRYVLGNYFQLRNILPVQCVTVCGSCNWGCWKTMFKKKNNGIFVYTWDSLGQKDGSCDVQTTCPFLLSFFFLWFHCLEIQALSTYLFYLSILFIFNLPALLMLFGCCLPWFEMPCIQSGIRS